MADKRDRVRLQRLLDDHSKLANNEFWWEFLNLLKKQANIALRQCATESFMEQKIRYYQGFYKALEMAYDDFPNRLLDEIKREIDK